MGELEKELAREQAADSLAEGDNLLEGDGR